MRALISVFDKSNLDILANFFKDQQIEIISTGGTKKYLEDLNFEITDASEVTNFPEILGGRVKTLHPHIHAGILAKHDDPEHKKVLKDLNIRPINFVVCNLYPFAANPTIENIDIGGPSMIRAAAKNHEHVYVLSNPNQYEGFIKNFENKNQNNLDLKKYRQNLATQAFEKTALYDKKIHRVLGGKEVDLRYGENPHQSSQLIVTNKNNFKNQNLISFTENPPLQGKALSYNNLLDADAAIVSLRAINQNKDDLENNSCVIIKHGTPCGAAKSIGGPTQSETIKQAISGDSTSAFGGIVCLSHELEAAGADFLAGMFLEIIIAPKFSQDAKAILARKKNLRLLEIPNLLDGNFSKFQFRSLCDGSILKQQHDFINLSENKVVTKRAPTQAEQKALDLAFRLALPTKSNAITLCDSQKLLGTGSGQTSRVDSVELAIKKALTHKHDLSTAALGSDAFFPFPDGIEIAAKAGITAIIQPGGSIKDQDVIDMADKYDLAMVFTGKRHFRH